MREDFADPADFDRVERIDLGRGGIILHVGHRGRRRELVAVEGEGAQLQDALALFEEWHDRPPRILAIRDVPDDTPPVLVRLGDVRGILYRSDKWTGEPTDYIHETEAPRPELFATPDGERIVILGGDMIATAAGLEG